MRNLNGKWLLVGVFVAASMVLYFSTANFVCGSESEEVEIDVSGAKELEDGGQWQEANGRVGP
jgi:hypothetical protein